MMKQVVTILFATTLLNWTSVFASNDELSDPYNSEYWRDQFVWEPNSSIKSVKERIAAVDTIIRLYEKDKTLTEADKAQVQKHLHVTVSASDIQQAYDQFGGIILVRSLCNQKLVIGCGSNPLAYATRRKEFKDQHSHNMSDTIHPNILMNPSVIAAFPPIERARTVSPVKGNLLGYFKEKDKKYSEIFVEGLCLFDLNPDQEEENLKNLHNLLEDRGTLTSNMHEFRIYDNQYIQEKQIELNVYYDDQSNPRYLFVNSEDFTGLLTFAHLANSLVGKKLETENPTQRLIGRQLYDLMLGPLKGKNESETQEIIDSNVTRHLRRLTKTDKLPKSLQKMLSAYGFAFESFKKVSPGVPGNLWSLSFSGQLTFSKIAKDSN